jgi:hypothetical protein
MMEDGIAVLIGVLIRWCSVPVDRRALYPYPTMLERVLA